MKKIFSKLIVGGATLSAVSGTAMAAVSCGSSSDNTAEYVSVLNQAVSQVLQDKRTETAKPGKDTDKTFTISIGDVTAAAAKIIKDKKLDISDKYFSHLYIFASFKKTDSAPTGVVSVSQNSSSRPTSISIHYDNKHFDAQKPVTPGDSSTVVTGLGKISIDIKERHLLVFKKLLGTINYNLNNSAYFAQTGGKWADPAMSTSNIFKSFDNTKEYTGTADSFLAVSQLPGDSKAAIGVTQNGIWYTSDATSKTVVWFLSNLKGQINYLNFNNNASGSDGKGMPTSRKADFASIQWMGSTAVIYAGMYSSTHTNNNDFDYIQTTLGTTFLIRTAIDSVNKNSDLVTVGSDANKTVYAAPMTAGAVASPERARPSINKLGLYFALGNHIQDGIQYSGNGAYIDKMKIGAAAGDATKMDTVSIARDTTGHIIDLLMSPDGNEGYLVFPDGVISSFDATDANNPNKNMKHYNLSNAKGYVTAAASNKGLFFLISGKDGNATGKVSVGIKYLARNADTNSKGVQVTSAIVDNQTAKAPYAFTNMDTYNNGKDARSIISTGNKNQTFIVSPSATDQSGMSIASDNQLTANSDELIKGSTSAVTTPGNKNDSGIVFATDKGDTFYLPEGSLTFQKTGSQTSKRGVVDAKAGPVGTIIINNKVFFENDLSKAVQTAAAKSMIMGTMDDGTTSNFIFVEGRGGESSNYSYTGATIAYSASALTWETA